MVAGGPSTTLTEFVSWYSLYRDVRPSTVRQYEFAAAALERWAGRPVAVGELTTELVSRWIRDYSGQVAASTAAGKRSMILVLWRAAADEGLVAAPTRRVRPVKQAARPVECWTREEVESIVTACRSLRRPHRCGLRRSEWWELAVRVAWDTGLRWADQMSLAAATAASSPFVVVQSKTRTPVICGLSPETRELLEASLRACPRALVTPWPASQESFLQQFRRLVVAAGVRPGTWRWLRRGSATDVALQSRADASCHLGHAPGSRITERHYLSAAILASDRAKPRSLRIPLDARTEST